MAKSLMDTIKWHHDGIDIFGFCQEWRFALADYLYWQFDVLVPGFRPTFEPKGEDYAYGLLQDKDPGQQEVQYAYDILTRYREWIRIAERDY